MLRTVLDYQFNVAGQPIDRSGQNNHGIAKSTVASAGPGDIRSVGFLSPAARIDVPYSDSWNHLNAVRVEIRVMLRELEHRVNLVEIERSLALFVRADGVVTFTFYAPEGATDGGGDGGGGTPASGLDFFTALPPPPGSVDPFDTLVANPPEPPSPFTWQGVNTDTGFSPDGVRRTVPLDRYITILAEHDGFATMRIYIDGVLAGEVNASLGVPPLVSPGIVAIGAWPHDDRYTLRGSIDFLRIWREDPEFPSDEFFCRPMTPEAHECWHRARAELAGLFDDSETRSGIRRLLQCVSELQLSMARAAARAGEERRRELRALSTEFLAQWCSGDIDGPEMREHFRRFIAFMQRVDPDGFAAILPRLSACFADPAVRKACKIGRDIPKCDPGWVGFIGMIVELLPDPICGDPGDDDPSGGPGDDDSGGGGSCDDGPGTPSKPADSRVPPGPVKGKDHPPTDGDPGKGYGASRRKKGGDHAHA